MYKWDKDKNDLLAQTIGVCFEDIVEAIDNGGILDAYEHPNQERYPNQKIFVISAVGYTYLVPYVKNGDEIFLKTIIPSRKAQKIYKGDNDV